MFVSGPVATRVIGCGVAATRSAMYATASSETAEPLAARKRRPVEAALAVHVSRDRELALERAFGSSGDRHVCSPDQLEHPQRVRRRLLERLVAVRRRDAE